MKSVLGTSLLSNMYITLVVKVSKVKLESDLSLGPGINLGLYN